MIAEYTLEKHTGLYFYPSDIDSIVDAMKEYAKQVATEALKDASENAKTKNVKIQYTGVRAGGYWIDKIVDKQSILNTEIKLP